MYLCLLGAQNDSANLTVNNIILALKGYSDQWIRIAEMLSLPNAVVSSILVSRLKDNEASLRKVVEWWFKNTPNPEWAAIDDVKTFHNQPVLSDPQRALHEPKVVEV